MWDEIWVQYQKIDHAKNPAQKNYGEIKVVPQKLRQNGKFGFYYSGFI